ncbi:MAG TPA: protein kinase [Polyangiaceae bacterium]|nr:protein kinase [Polyangiaceae bacterium]
MQANAGEAPNGTFERVAVVRTIPGRKLPLAIVHAFSATGVELAVQERYATSPTGLDAADLDILEQDARRAMALHHPNMAAVRDVAREGEEVSVVSEFVEGEVLEELRRLGATGTSFSIEVGVRIVVDVLSALNGLHTLGEPGLAHGEVTTHNVLVGYDGATRLLRPYRGRVAGKVAETDWFGYAAPEVLKGQPPDARADLFSVGVLLWETLTKRRLFPNATREGRTSRSVPIGKASPPPDASWAAPLAAVAERALASDPQARYASAAEMAAAVRLAVRSKLAMPPRVAAVVDKLAGERIVQRRVSLALPETPTRPSAPSRPPVSNEAARVLEAMRPPSRPPTPSPGPVIVPAVPKAPAVPSIEAREAKFHVAKPDLHAKPRPAAPPLKLSEPKAPAPKALATPIAPATAPKASAAPIAAPPAPHAGEPTPISLDSALLSAAESSPAFGIEPPTVPRKPKPEDLEVVAPPADLLDAAKAFEVSFPAPREPAKPAAREPVKPAPSGPIKPAAREPAKPAPSEPAKPAAKPAVSEPAKAAPSERPAPLVDPSVITSPVALEEPPGAPQPTATSLAPAGIGAQRGKRVLIGVGAVCLLLLLGAGIRFLVVGKGDTASPVPTETARRPQPSVTATAPAAPPATAPTVTAEPSATEPAPEDSAAPSPSASPTPVPDGSSRRRHPKPRPTYDPMGI